MNYVVGIDFGTDSVRAVLIDTRSGDETASDIFHFPRWAEGKFCSPIENQFRQHPLDHLEGLKQTVRRCLAKAPQGCANKVAAISIDTTGSSPMPVDDKGVALALKPEFADNPNAMLILWKDHTAVAEAQEINQLAKTWGGVDFTAYSGGVYSSEWFFSKILHILRIDPAVRREAHTWVEHCDWVPALLTNTLGPDQLKRSVCAAGHKAMWHESWSGLPAEEFLQLLDPVLIGLRSRLYDRTFTADRAAGGLTEEWSHALGLPAGIPVGVGAIDAHMGAVGGGITPYSLVRVIGTSTCDMLIAPPAEVGNNRVRGICGQVPGSIVPGMIGMEAGQSAYGDIYAWFRSLLSWPLRLISDSEVINPQSADALIEEMTERLIPALSEAAQAINTSDSEIVAVDWLNGRRTPDANQALKGAIAGLNLGSDAPRIFHALVEATAYGGKAIVERFLSEGVNIKEVIAIGGVARKSPFAMQVLADVLDLEIKVARSENTVALGAAMFAAVVGGVFKDIDEAQTAMGCGIETVYRPRADKVAQYRVRYEAYRKVGRFIEAELTTGARPVTAQ